MMKLIKKVTVGLATFGLLGAILTSAAFAQTNTIDGNGAFSKSKIKTSSNCVVWLQQKNNTTVTTVVSQKGVTGKNSSNFNVGGSQTTTTGDVTNTAGVTVVTGGNDATLVDPCCLCQDVGDNSISDNGAFSNNKIKTSNNSLVGVSQNNKLTVTTVVGQSGNTGGNHSSFNVGSGTTTDTGLVDNTTDVLVSGGSNTASL